MKTHRFLFLKVLGILAMLFVIYGVACKSYRSRFAPAQGILTFADLQRQGVPMKRALTIPPLQGHVCVMADDDSLWWILCSGPPAYHFDAAGRLIDFTLDVGDSTQFQYVYDIYQGAEVAMPDLAARFLETGQR